MEDQKKEETKKEENTIEEPKTEEHEAPDLKALMKVESMLRKSIAEEQEAAAVYIERAQKCIEHEDFKLAALFEELAGDEIVHAASLETALDMYFRKVLKILPRKNKKLVTTQIKLVKNLTLLVNIQEIKLNTKKKKLLMLSMI